MNTRVIHVREAKHYPVTEREYIGRAMPRQHIPASIWGNPFYVGRDGTREEVIAKYRAYLLGRPDLLARLPELKGRVLVCWCKPAACHGDVLAGLADATE